MTTITTTVFTNARNKFFPCDKETYKKLKAIRRFTEFAKDWAGRWERAQKRLLKNRTFRLFYDGKIQRIACKDSWLFGTFFTAGQNTRKVWSNALGYHQETTACIDNTPLYIRFLNDYQEARTPKDTAEEVVQPNLTVEELDAILAEIQAWHTSGK